MKVYTVRKPEPNTDREYKAYTDLLQSIGIDVANVPRTPEPGTSSRWLYVWKSKPQAERFARELGERLRDRTWQVHGFELPDEQLSNEVFGPLVPLTILSIPTSEGTEFHLESASQQRILTHYPNANSVGRMEFPTQMRQDYQNQHGSVWEQVIIVLTGIPNEAIERLGGVRIVTTDGEVLHERVPDNSCA